MAGARWRLQAGHDIAAFGTRSQASGATAVEAKKQDVFIWSCKASGTEFRVAAMHVVSDEMIETHKGSSVKTYRMQNGYQQR